MFVKMYLRWQVFCLVGKDLYFYYTLIICICYNYLYYYAAIILVVVLVFTSFGFDQCALLKTGFKKLQYYIKVKKFKLFYVRQPRRDIDPDI
jgi:hypothetical protein